MLTFWKWIQSCVYWAPSQYCPLIVLKSFDAFVTMYKFFVYPLDLDFFLLQLTIVLYLYSYENSRGNDNMTSFTMHRFTYFELAMWILSSVSIDPI